MFKVLIERAPGHLRTDRPHRPWLAPTKQPEPLENSGREKIAPTGRRNALLLRLSDERPTGESGSAGCLADGRGLSYLGDLPLTLLSVDSSSFVCFSLVPRLSLECGVVYG